MLSFDSSLMNVYRQAMMSFPTSSPSDAILFGKNIRYQPFVLLTLTEDQRFAIDRAKKYALEQSIQNALSKQAAQLHQQDLNTIKRNQALILLSRIYVGSISFEVGEDDIRKTFSPFGPIKSVALSWDSTLQKHKGFAFIEFEVPEAASLALEQMNGYTLAGRNLKVGRPSNAPQTGNLEAELRADESTRYRVYVASVHPELTESDIQTVFEAFGKVKSCTLYPDPKSPGRHRGFGYIEFESEEAVIAAVSSMNCFDLAGQQLRVGRAIIPKDSPLPFEAATAKPNSTSVAATQASVSAVALAAASISAQVMSMSAEEASAAAAVPDGTAAFNLTLCGEICSTSVLMMLFNLVS
ncbi:Poly U-binding-splicing factor half pint [Paragonimus heterotremus]|uniref:Poly U-binding-splicing factor half pint n=1 Tax=Paragonimus heterotremus TaxID=100268 RepID=A0A8J4TK84_9TREM|nr:Poly U-binding-splicing factor half pint [Paragonimus heterotremus]